MNQLGDNSGIKGGSALTISQPIIPLFVPFWLNIALCLRLGYSLNGRDIGSRDKAAGVVHDSSNRALKVVTDSHQDSACCRVHVVVSDLEKGVSVLPSSVQQTEPAYMEHQTSSITAAEEGDNIVHTADPKENQVFPLGGKERAEYGIFVEFEGFRGLSLPWGQPRRPGPDQGEPPTLGQ
jgi:hypothetical protein